MTKRGNMLRYLRRTPKSDTIGFSCDCATKLRKDFGFDELKGSSTLSFDKPDDNDTDLDEPERRQRQSRMQFVHCPLTSAKLPPRDDRSIKRLLRYFGWISCMQHDRWLQS